MENSSEKAFGFECEHNGKRYMFDVIAETRQEAEGRLASMIHARCVGEICAASSFHASDCAKHDAPAYEAGACSCGAETKARR